MTGLRCKQITLWLYFATLPEIAWCLLTIQNVASLGTMMEEHLCSVFRTVNRLHSGWTPAFVPWVTSHPDVWLLRKTGDHRWKGNTLLTKFSAAVDTLQEATSWPRPSLVPSASIWGLELETLKPNMIANKFYLASQHLKIGRFYIKFQICDFIWKIRSGYIPTCQQLAGAESDLHFHINTLSLVDQRPHHSYCLTRTLSGTWAWQFPTSEPNPKMVCHSNPFATQTITVLSSQPKAPAVHPSGVGPPDSLNSITVHP